MRFELCLFRKSREVSLVRAKSGASYDRTRQMPATGKRWKGSFV